MHTAFTTTTRGLERESFPMRLFEKAKKFGVWNPSDIDLTQDREDWLRMSSAEQTLILHLTALFQAGEEAVTLDLLPLIMTIAKEGRLEEEMFLTTFLFEEAKHTDFFARFLYEVTGNPTDLARFHTDAYKRLFYEALPEALNRLHTDTSAEAQLRASATYNMIVEGVLAETGYHAFFSMLERNQLMPGMQKGISLLKQDESRHIAYGLHLLTRLITTNPELFDALEDQMNMLLMSSIEIIAEIFAQYDPVPFGLEESEFVDYATTQFAHRMEKLEQARDGIPA
jgi:ribonucleoside-diphosphate reductase beta chain